MAVRACTSHLAVVPARPGHAFSPLSEPTPLDNGERGHWLGQGHPAPLSPTSVGLVLLPVFLRSPVVTADTLWACGLRWPFVCSSLTYCPTALVVTQDNGSAVQAASGPSHKPQLGAGAVTLIASLGSTRRIRNLHLTWPGALRYLIVFH